MCVNIAETKLAVFEHQGSMHLVFAIEEKSDDESFGDMPSLCSPSCDDSEPDEGEIKTPRTEGDVTPVKGQVFEFKKVLISSPLPVRRTPHTLEAIIDKLGPTFVGIEMRST